MCARVCDTCSETVYKTRHEKDLADLAAGVYAAPTPNIKTDLKPQTPPNTDFVCYMTVLLQVWEGEGGVGADDGWCVTCGAE